LMAEEKKVKSTFDWRNKFAYLVFS
jgi:hypothetical protein